MKGIIGAIAGDIIGSRYEFKPIKTKEFSLFNKKSTFTDDTIMTLAVAKWLINDKNSKEELVRQLQYFGNGYPNGGYGRMFKQWLSTENPKPYGSWGNGSAMRVSPVAWVGESLEEVQKLARISAEVTHDHPEGIKGALATADAVYLARLGSSKEEIRDHIEIRYGYDLNRTLDEIRPSYKFDVSCQGSVPESIICFLEGEDYEDTIRNCISLGGDADTMAAIAGGIASAYWEVPRDIQYKSIERLSYELLNVLIEFEDKFL
ncbi:ADP-ribosylglycohydrolase family protein [Methanobrevibacter sp.]|uniref:ADP-ribosylglycohydrolase family protein n=1 Tax=Methanobrevibacter sp. TaxID=66852 RepID=UPI0025FD8E85|nr:ADP-ribosylglycohydrolase family protein [Methanobrevibacter sp.]MBQ2962885.1 ADP-ribosylglycohydrolase family protein [Methanobrevibacter sp.]